ncbi:MAG TPA: hypothetical protein VN961_09310, partial [Streptosporangiaceae bacterium]|nr:hypothetical protein [Streptosporangiaceae bacterium]
MFAYLKEQGYDLDRTSPTPDFAVTGDAPVAIEVTTSNPPEDADPDDVDPSVGLRRLVPYGRRDVATYDADGNLELTAETISDHQHEGKSSPAASSRSPRPPTWQESCSP